VVIDRAIGNHACGGLRMVPDLSLEELKGLARSMTLKYSFSEMEQGGAKAGIVADYNIKGIEKQNLLRRFGEIIAPLLKSKYYITGTDINTSKVEIIDMLDNCGASIPKRRREKGNKSGFFTAMSVMIGSETSASYTKLKLNNCSIAIEGFGAVGSSYAWLMSKKHASKIIAISTLKGALFNKNGLDIDELFQLKDKYGDDLINYYSDAERIENSSLFELKVDIISPCARHFSINESNANKIQASIVCPGANIPVTSGADKILFDRNIISIPAFVSNCGGVIGNRIEMTGLSDNYIENYLRKRNTPRIISLIEKSKELQIPLTQIAEQEAMNNLRLTQLRTQNIGIKKRLYKLSSQLVNGGFLPELILKKAGAYYFDHTIKE
jgi:glutamate dehydrogenase (NAD(P)+)